MDEMDGSTDRPHADEQPTPPDAAAATVAPGVPSAPKRRRGPVIAGVAIGVVAAVGGGAFAVTQLSGPNGNTPEQAVASMLESVAKGDVLGMMEALAPGERDVMLDSVVPLVDQLRRLEVLDRGLDLKKVGGVDGSLTDYKASAKRLRDDLSAVRVTGGTLVTRFDPHKLPLGRLIRDNAGEQIDKAKSSRTVTQLRMKASDDPVIVLKDGKRWYVSLGYSIAEAARWSDSDYEAPNFAMPAAGGGVAAKGASSPAEAVSQLIDAASRLDARRMIELMPPDELAALHDYAGQFIGDAEKAVSEATGKYKLSFPGLTMKTAQSGDRATVTIVSSGIDFALTDPNQTPFRARYAGRCVTLTLDADTKKRCGKDIVKFLEDFGVPVDVKTLEKSLDQSASTARRSVDIGFTAVRRDGKWFVSPMRTMLDAMTATLKSVSRSDVDKIEKQIRDAVQAVRDGTTLNSVDPSLGDPTFDVGDTLPVDAFPTETLPPDTLPADTVADTLPADPFFSGAGSAETTVA